MTLQIDFCNMKTRNYLLGVIFILALGSTLFLMEGCRGDVSRELIMLDSLDAALLETTANMNIDKETIAARKKEINKHYTIIKKFYTDTISEDFGNKMQKYKGIMKVYNLFLKEYDHMVLEKTQLTEQVAKLRKSVKNGKIDKKEFRVYYDIEKHDIAINLELSRHAGRTVIEVEPEYQRLSKEIAEVINGLAIKNPEIKTWLEE
jgi:hypothetical protein